MVPNDLKARNAVKVDLSLIQRTEKLSVFYLIADGLSFDQVVEDFFLLLRNRLLKFSSDLPYDRKSSYLNILIRPIIAFATVRPKGMALWSSSEDLEKFRRISLAYGPLFYYSFWDQSLQQRLSGHKQFQLWSANLDPSLRMSLELPENPQVRVSLHNWVNNFLDQHDRWFEAPVSNEFLESKYKDLLKTVEQRLSALERDFLFSFDVSEKMASLAYFDQHIKAQNELQTNEHRNALLRLAQRGQEEKNIPPQRKRQDKLAGQKITS